MQNTRVSQRNNTFLSSILFVLSCGLFGILSRLLPHPPGMTAFTSFCMLSGLVNSSRLTVSVLILLLGFISDILLSYSVHSPLWGYWMLFVYSGYLFLFLSGYLFRSQQRIFSRMMILTVGSLIFWLWTNLGMWLFSGVYIHSLPGFIQCYAAALPFLRNGLIGDLLWGLLIIQTQQMLISLSSYLIKDEGLARACQAK